MRKLRLQHGRPDAAKMVVLVTDGQSDDTIATLHEADLLKNSSTVTLSAVGVGQFLDKVCSA